MTDQPKGASPRFPGFVELDAPLQEPDASAWRLMNNPGYAAPEHKMFVRRGR